jgi:hypothetical protein
MQTSNLIVLVGELGEHGGVVAGRRPVALLGSAVERVDRLVDSAVWWWLGRRHEPARDQGRSGVPLVGLLGGRVWLRLRRGR